MTERNPQIHRKAQIPRRKKHAALQCSLEHSSPIISGPEMPRVSDRLTQSLSFITRLLRRIAIDFVSLGGRPPRPRILHGEEVDHVQGGSSACRGGTGTPTLISSRQGSGAKRERMDCCVDHAERRVFDLIKQLQGARSALTAD